MEIPKWAAKVWTAVIRMKRIESLFTEKARDGGNSLSSLSGMVGETEHWQELCNSGHQSCCWQPLGLKGAWSCERMDDFTEAVVQANMEGQI